MKKVALLLFGISYSEYKHWNRHWFKNNLMIDYKYSYENYQKYIFKYFNNLNYDIDVFFCTNKSSKQDEIIKLYKPKSYMFIDNLDSNHLSKNIKIKNVLELCINYSSYNNIDYENVIMSRFDLYFLDDFNKVNIDLNKFNFVSIMEKDNRICDNFYIFPFKIIKKFLRIINSKLDISLHFIYNDVEDISEINFIKNENVDIANLSFYKIIRNPIEFFISEMYPN